MVSGAFPPTSADDPRMISTRASSVDGKRPTTACAMREPPPTRSPSIRIITESRTMPRERIAIEPSAPGVPTSTPGSLPMTSLIVSAPMFSISVRVTITFWVADSRRSATSFSPAALTVTALSIFSSAPQAVATDRQSGRRTNRFMVIYSKDQTARMSWLTPTKISKPALSRSMRVRHGPSCSRNRAPK